MLDQIIIDFKYDGQ